MQSNLENLRLSVGLAHAVPGAELVLRTRDGAELVAGHYSTADVNLCALRRAVVASGCPNRPDVSRWADPVRIDGSLDHHLAGIHLFGPGVDRPPTWWFPTLVKPQRVWDIVEGRTWTDDDDLIEVVIKPDPCLGMTAVAVGSRVGAPDDMVASATEAVYEACLLEELIDEAGAAMRTPGEVER
ncbi:MAG: hypothetical protein AAF547_16600 [Actinomycetota bacterium]